MKKYTCKNPSCNRIFEYCRGCLLSPIPHMDAGFCSKQCYEASKIEIPEEVKIQITEIVDAEPLDDEVCTVEIFSDEDDGIHE